MRRKEFIDGDKRPKYKFRENGTKEFYVLDVLDTLNEDNVFTMFTDIPRADEYTDKIIAFLRRLKKNQKSSERKERLQSILTGITYAKQVKKTQDGSVRFIREEQEVIFRIREDSINFVSFK